MKKWIARIWLGVVAVALVGAALHAAGPKVLLSAVAAVSFVYFTLWSLWNAAN